MPNILAISDLHLEWGNKITIDKIDGVDILVLAGDIGSYKSHLGFIQDCCKKYKVIYVLGNHEFYGHSLKEVRDFWKSVEIENFYFLDDSSVVVDGIEFIGSTLWVNFNNGDFHSMYNAPNEIKDFQKIINSTGDEYITPEDVLLEFQKSFKFLEKAIYEKSQFKKVLVTHYGVSHQSVHPKYLQNIQYMKLNHYYTNNLDYFIGYSELCLAIHGHMHTSADYMIGDCRVFCNPLGYPESLNSSFSSAKIIEI